MLFPSHILQDENNEVYKTHMYCLKYNGYMQIIIMSKFQIHDQFHHISALNPQIANNFEPSLTLISSRKPTRTTSENYLQTEKLSTVFKGFLSSKQFPQKNAEAVDIIFDCPGRVGIFEHFRRHVSNCSTSGACRCLSCKLSFPLC